MRTKEKKSTRRLGRFWKIDTSRLAHSVRKCSLASIGCVKTLCVFLHPLVRGKSPNTPCRTRADSTTSGQMLRRWFAKTMHKASCQWLAFLLAKKWQKIFFCHHWPLVFCMIINQHRRANAPEGLNRPLGRWRKPVGGYFRQNSACIFEITLLLFCTPIRRLYYSLRDKYMHIHIIG